MGKIGKSYPRRYAALGEQHSYTEPLQHFDRHLTKREEQLALYRTAALVGLIAFTGFAGWVTFL